MHGGQQGVGAATIQLYAVGTTGDASAATPLIGTLVTTSDGTGNSTDSNASAANGFNSFPAGAFTITGDFTCSPADTQVYLVASGGNPGLAIGTNNAAIALMAALGPCTNLSSSTSLIVNEITTVGSIAPLAPFMASYATLGSATGDAAQLTANMAEVNEYTDTATGATPGPALPNGYSAPTYAIDALADIAAGCVNSSGGVAGDSTACGELFTLATPPGGTAPTDTIGALVNIQNNPTLNVSSIFTLLEPKGPFQPTLAASPASWALPITPTGATQLAFVSQPTTVGLGVAIAPSVTVAVEDNNGNVLSSATNTVTLGVGNNGIVQGTVTANAVAGIATFSNVKVSPSGSGYTLTASSSGLTGATSSAFDVSAAAILIGNLTIGNNMIAPLTISLPNPLSTATTVTIRSTQTSYFLFSTSPTTKGSSSLSVTVAAGSTSVPAIYVQGENYPLPGTHFTTAITGTVTATASGYSTGSATLSLYPSGIGFSGADVGISAPNTSTVPIPVGLLVLTPGTLTVVGLGSLGPQAQSLLVPVVSSNTSVARIAGASNTWTVNGSGLSQTEGFDPLTYGTSTLSLAEPSGYYTPSTASWAASTTATVNTPAFVIANGVVGNNLMIPLPISLSYVPSANTTLTVTSSNSTYFLLSTTPNNVGSASVSVALTAGSATIPTIYVQGRNSPSYDNVVHSNPVAITGGITATASGVTTGSGTVTLYPSGIGLSGADTGITVDTNTVGPITAGLLVLNPGTLTVVGTGSLGPPAGEGPTYTVASSNTSVGLAKPVCEGCTATGYWSFNGSGLNQALNFQPVGLGSTTLSIVEPSGYAVPTSTIWATSMTATVTTPGITLANTIVGQYLVTPLAISLTGNAASSTSMTVSIGSSPYFGLSTDPSLSGSSSVTVSLTAGSATVPTIYLVGRLYDGSTALTGTITATASGYTNGSATASLYPSGLGFVAADTGISTYVGGADAQITVAALVLKPGTLTVVGPGTVSGYLPPGYKPRNSNTAVGVITGSNGVWSANGLGLSYKFQPAEAGTSTLTLTEPSQYYVPNSTTYASSTTATVYP